MRQVCLLALISAMLLLAPTAHAQRPVSGMPVPALDMMDDMIQAYMDSFAVDAVVAGISFRGKIIYLRGFGWEDENLTMPLQENATFRVASITKTFTATVIWDLIDRGMLNRNDFAFNVGGNGGVLNISPAPEIIDPNIEIITIDHLLQHSAGWYLDLIDDDLPSDDLRIQEEMGLAQLATREEMMSWILEHELQHVPGSEYAYSNIGYHALGLIADQVSGTNLMTYVRTHLLKDELYFPSNDMFMGRSFAEDQDPREPYYYSPHYVTNVFNPPGPPVQYPYGGWHHEVKESYVSLVSSGVPLLHQANKYQLNGYDKGEPIGVEHGNHRHGGVQPGNSSLLQQRSDYIDFIVMTNSRESEDGAHGRPIGYRINKILDQYYIPWPFETVDCVWFDTGYTGEERGSYDLPFNSVNDLGNIHAFTKVKFKPGSTSWTG